jgi:hypothetical protein
LFRYVQYGAGIGLLLLSVHGLTDFNWHIPANALYSAFLAGLFLVRVDETESEIPTSNYGILEEAEPQKIYTLPTLIEPVRSPFDS